MQSDCCFMYSEMKAGLKMTGDVGSPAPPRQEVCSSISTLMSRSGYSRCTAAPGPPTGCRTIWCRRQGTAFLCAWSVCMCGVPSCITTTQQREKLDLAQTFRLQCFSAVQDCGAVHGAETASMKDPCSLPHLWSWFWSRKNMLIQQP